MQKGVIIYNSQSFDIVDIHYFQYYAICPTFVILNVFTASNGTRFYLLSFSVEDGTGSPVVNSVPFTVNVIDVNDVSPVFAPNAYTGPVQENSAQGQFNPYLTNGFSHRYQMGESTFIFRGVRSDF